MAKSNSIDTRAPTPLEAEYISRSAQKREANEVERLSEGLIALKASEYSKLILDEELKPALDLARKITAHIAKRRQMLFVAKLLRKREALLPALYIAVDKPKSELKKVTAKMHRAERWRERLLAEGDPAMQAFIEQHINVDRQELRSLQRAATANRLAVAEGKRDNGSYNALYKFLILSLDAESPEKRSSELQLDSGAEDSSGD